MVQVDHNFKNQRSIHHHLQVHLHPQIEVSIMAIIKDRPAKSQGSVAQGGIGIPSCGKCGKTHSCRCRDGKTSCFKCGKEGHLMRECPKNKQGSENSDNRA